jgi:hypothetical protein
MYFKTCRCYRAVRSLKFNTAFIAAGLVLMTNPSLAETSVSTVAELPSGTFLENLVISDTGDTVLTSYMDRQILLLDADNNLSVLADLTVHPVGILKTTEGYLVTAHGSPFTSGPEFTQDQQIMQISVNGDVTHGVPVNDALFLNGMTQLPDGRVLVADSIAGTIWQFDPASQQTSPWLQHPLLTQNPDIPVFLPGANGLKFDDGRLLISNSGRGALYQIDVGPDGAALGEPSIIADTGPIDEFLVAGDQIVVATHGAALKAVDVNGDIITLMSEGCDGCTSVQRRGDAYLVLTTGGLLEGQTDPVRILEIQKQ